MKRALCLPVLALVLSLAAACTHGTTGAGCVETTGASVARLTTGKCIGSARSCSSYAVYDISSARPCAHHQGCTPASDIMSCEGTTVSCAAIVYDTQCNKQDGCSWSDAETSGGGGSSGPAASGDPPSAPPPCGAVASDGGVAAPGASDASSPSPSNPSGTPGSPEPSAPPAPPGTPGPSGPSPDAGQPGPPQ